MRSFHPKTARRVVTLLVGMAVLIGLLAAVYLVRQRQIERQLLAVRNEGLAALKQGDYPTALNQLRRYVSRHKNDPEALFGYGMARAHVEEPGSFKHIEEPIHIFRTVLDLQPENRQARHMLLELYTRSYRNTEAIDLAEEVLARHPDDADALRAEAIALERLRRFEESAAVYERLNAVAPTDLAGQLATYGLYRRIKKDPKEILARAQRMADDHPDDPRFVMLLAIAYGEAGDMDRAVALLKQAASTDAPPDAEFVRTLATILERNRMYDEAQALLERAASRTSDPAVIRVLVQRLWQDGRYADVAERLNGLDPSDASSDTSLLAYRAMSLFDLHRPAEAQAIVAALQARTNDSAAQAWGTALKARLADPPLEPKQAIEQYQSALARDATNGVIRFFIGEAYEQLGESEPAREAWERCAELVPSWARPHDKIARVLAATGRTREAIEQARQAMAAAPGKLYPAVTLAVVYYMHLGQSPEAGDAEALLRSVTEIQRQKPNEPETLPIYVSLLARSGRREQAIRVLQALLEGPAPAASAPAGGSATAASRGTSRPSATTAPAELDQNVLLRLVTVSRNEHLGMEQALLERIERSQSNQVSPQLALARAGVLASQGRPMDGLQLLLDAARAAGGIGPAGAPSTRAAPAEPLHPDGAATSAATAGALASGIASARAPAVQWKLALAEYREYVHDPDAAADWIALGDANADDLQVQTAILKLAPSTRSDRAFIARTIERVRRLTGEQGTFWRIQQAQWLLESDEERDLSTAVNMLNDVVRASPTLMEPRLLLAMGLEKVDNVFGAIKELESAVALDPNKPAIALELVRLLQGQGQFDEAHRDLQSLSANAGDLTPEMLRQVAAMLSQQGQTDEAVALLESAYPGRLPASQPSATEPSEQTVASPEAAERLDQSGQLLLAELYRRRGRFADAQAVYDRLLARAAPEAEVLHAAADFHASRGNFTTAQSILARLAQTQLRPGVRELILADFNERYSPTREVALRYYRAAARAAPTDPLAWRELALFLLRWGQSAEAISAVEEGLHMLPRDQRLRTLRQRVAAIAELMRPGEPQPPGTSLRAIIDDLSRDPESTATAAALEVLRTWHDGSLPRAQMITRLRQLAGRYPRSKPIQIELVQQCVAAGSLDEAVEAARKAMDMLPEDAEIAELLVAVLRRTGDFAAVEQAARQWRQRSLEQPMRADVAIAEALLEQSNPAGAIEELTRYLPAALAQPETHARLIATAARALVAAGREAEARALLEPPARRSKDWRMTWLDIAGNDLPDAGLAERWLDEAKSLIDRDDHSRDPAEEVALAAAWNAAGRRFNQPRMIETARKILSPLTGRADARADALFLLGSMDEAAGDAESAEQHYRQALQRQDDYAAAMNNLAYLLLSQNDSSPAEDDSSPESDAASASLDESRRLAERAVHLVPDNPDFHDTLGRVYLRLGRPDDALAEFQRALELDPGMIDSLIGQTTTLLALHRPRDAADILVRIDAVLHPTTVPTHPAAPAIRPVLREPLRRELDAARRALAASNSP